MSLKEIAKQLKQIPKERFPNIDTAQAVAGRLLSEAIASGAFARVRHVTMRQYIDRHLERNSFSGAFLEAVCCLRKKGPGDRWPVGASLHSYGFMRYGCPLLAKAIEAEASVADADKVLSKPATGLLAKEVEQERITREQRRNDESKQIANQAWKAFLSKKKPAEKQLETSDRANMDNMLKNAVKLSQVRGKLSVNVKTLRRWIKEGKLKSYRPRNVPKNSPHYVLIESVMKLM